MSISSDDPTNSYFTFTSFPGVSEREVVRTVQLWYTLHIYSYHDLGA